MLSEIINSLPDECAFMEMIGRFELLLLKHARILDYEDSYNDLLLFFMELIVKMKDSNISERDDAIIVSYIATSVKNQYIKLSKQRSANIQYMFSELSEAQQIHIESLISCFNDSGIGEYYLFKSVLTPAEWVVLRLIYEAGYSVAEVASMTGKTRQSVNQAKNRALRKLRATETS